VAQTSSYSSVPFAWTGWRDAGITGSDPSGLSRQGPAATEESTYRLNVAATSTMRTAESLEYSPPAK
jgi:hypothetical protein